MDDQIITNNPSSALRSNIKEKGEFSYYYAHKDNLSNNGSYGIDVKVIEGPGIVTGGSPILLYKEKDLEKNLGLETVYTVNSYSWADCGNYIKLYITFDNLISNLPHKAKIKIKGTPEIEALSNSLNIKIFSEYVIDELNNCIQNSELSNLKLPIIQFCLLLTNLFRNIEPNSIKLKTSSDKITIIVTKEDPSIKWINLCKFI
ncbi:uncharacterized protein CMU_021490 [Cryptosporidium muris RN66]|uniref:CS domain-containing protein n=1 Tax=Cryptosporidium muris (strain RN66) TaxID=441375 RepID=B6AJJ4_CRYMR|nr:uncharacterized protein CMU_021490 [Cryptosporidium muris RN66]EEA08385.1 hypothetical protein, conserved [Cryptosporidium muris RN66]|eukprot:XP_002142734.1 hypothetical protein [Cryptosporidium muris RN66]